MKNTLLAIAVTAVTGFTSMAPRANAAPGDSLTFSMVRAAGATCLSNRAHGRMFLGKATPLRYARNT